MSRDKKLTDKEKSAMDDALKGATITDAELERLAEGVDESGEVVMPVEDGEDLVTAAALAMEFVDGLEIPDLCHKGYMITGLLLGYEQGQEIDILELGYDTSHRFPQFLQLTSGE